MEKDLSTKFEPAMPGWLALFQYEVDGEVEVHAKPVIACCPAAESGESHHYSLGKAVIGANQE